MIFRRFPAILIIKFLNVVVPWLYRHYPVTCVCNPWLDGNVPYFFYSDREV